MQVASGATIRPDLMDAVKEYASDLNSQFMALDVLPLANTDFQSGSFGSLPIENLTDQSSAGKRAPGSGYNRQQSEITTDTYTCEEFGFEEPVDDGEARRMGIYFDAELGAAQINEFRLRRAQEVRAASLLFSTSNFSGHTGNVTNEWNDATNGVPYSDVQGKLLTLKQAVGGAIDGEICLAVSEKVFRNMYMTAEIKAMRAGGAGGTFDKVAPSAAEMANILGINQVFHSSAQNAAADIWDDEYALLFIRSMSPILSSSVQLGRTFLWTADTDANATIESYRDEAVRSNIVRARQYCDEKVFNYAAGYLFQNITS
jgi:hypothetical protein